MSIERGDFWRRLQAAVDSPFVQAGSDACVAADGRWRIALADLPDLSIGLLRLARLQVKIELISMDDAAAAAFHARFDAYFQRGGG